MNKPVPGPGVPDPRAQLYAFAHEVGSYVARHYGYQDGSSLCYNLVEQGVIKFPGAIQTAAEIVAQHLEQQ